MNRAAAEHDDNGRLVRHRWCTCCGAGTLGGAALCRFCAIERCGGACGPIYFNARPRR